MGSIVDSVLGGGSDATTGVTNFDVSSATGSSSFNADTGRSTTTLSPEMQALFDQQNAQAQTSFGDVAGAGQSGYNASTGLFGTAGATQAGVAGAGQAAQNLATSGFNTASATQAGVAGAGSGALSGASGLLGTSADLFSGVAGAGASAQAQGQGFLNQAQEFDPFAAAETQFSRLDDILSRSSGMERTGTQGALLASGRLGSSAGARVQGSLEQGIQDQRAQLLDRSFSQAQGVQDSLINRGTNLTQLGMSQQQQQQGFGQDAFGNALGLGQFGLQQQGQQQDLVNAQTQNALGAGGYGLDQQAQQQNLSSQQLSDAMGAGEFGMQQQLGTQALGTQALTNSLGIDAQGQGQLALGSNITKHEGQAAVESGLTGIVRGGLTAAASSYGGKT